jgi:predicted DNA-binding WGR domain protein
MPTVPYVVAAEPLPVTPEPVVLERSDAARNMARYYVLSIEPSLFGDTALVRHWGRLGRTGRHRIDLFRQRAHAIETLEAWLARKTRRGYAARG